MCVCVRVCVFVDVRERREKKRRKKEEEEERSWQKGDEKKSTLERRDHVDQNEDVGEEDGPLGTREPREDVVGNYPERVLRVVSEGGIA